MPGDGTELDGTGLDGTGLDSTGLDVIARGSADADTLGGRQRAASFYADPVAWLVVDAVQAALDEAGAEVRDAGAEVGMVSVSDTATQLTMRQMVAGIGRGRVSPLRFAGANPGSIAGLPCIVFGFRGPSLVFSMPPDAARPVTTEVARSWLATGGCRYVIVNEHEVRADGGHAVRSVIVRHT